MAAVGRPPAQVGRGMRDVTMNLLWALTGTETILLGVVGVGAVVFVVLALFVIATYNRLVALRNRFKNAFSQIDVQLKRRYDLIPNLVETVKGYMKHESGTLEAVIQARNSAATAGRTAAQKPGDASAMTGLAGAQGQVQRAPRPPFAGGGGLPPPQANPTKLPPPG